MTVEHSKLISSETKNGEQAARVIMGQMLPDYTGQKVCGITVHFLPCDEIQVSTFCYAYGSPESPIKKHASSFTFIASKLDPTVGLG